MRAHYTCMQAHEKTKIIFKKITFFLQHANEDVEKMILGNKCDMDDKRQVATSRGEGVSILFLYNN